MEDQFRISAEIHAMQGCLPIRFVHARGVDRPENHQLHLNNHVEIYIYIEGNHQYIVEDSLFPLKRGDIVIINPREVHKAVPMEEVVYERFYLLVEPRAFEQMYCDPLQPILKKQAGALNLISLEASAKEKILELLYSISALAKEGREFSALCALFSIIDQINLHLEEAAPQSAAPHHTPSLLKKIFAYVAENPAEIQAVSEVADALGLTPQYLSSYFSRQVGTSLKSYIQAKKIALGKELLSKGANATEACFGCGFNDCSYFVKVFKKYIGCTPSAYRQKIKIKSG